MPDIRIVVNVERAAPLPKPVVTVGVDQDDDKRVTESELHPAAEESPDQHVATVPLPAGSSGTVLWRVIVRAAAGSTYTAKATIGSADAERGSGKVGVTGLGLLLGKVSI